MNKKEKADSNVCFICSLLRIIKTGFEPVTSTLPVWRAPSCANAPTLVDNTINPQENQVLFFQLFILIENS